MEQPSNNSVSDVEMESEDEEAAMAAAMGFSGFGKAPATKKRKYNSRIDAFIDGQELQNIDKGGKKGQGSGGNEVPLGRMRVLGASSVEEEQSKGQGYVETRGEEVDDRPMEERCLDTSRPPPAEEKLKNDARRAERRGRPMINEDEIMLDDDEEDDRTAPPRPSEDTAAQDAQRKIDAIVAATATQPSAAPISEATDTPAFAPKPRQKQKQKPKPAQGLAAFMTALQTPVIPPPSIPPPGTTSETIIPPTPITAITNHTYTIEAPSSLPQRPPQSAPSGGRGGKGQRNELWYVDYYDPSFNENPWKQLEKENGLEPVGTWVERPTRNR